MTNEEKTEVMETTNQETSEKKAVPWWKNKRAQYGMIAGACALIISGGAGIAIASNQPTPAEKQAEAPAKVEQPTVDKVTNNANAGTDARSSNTDEEKQQAQETTKQESINAEQSSSNASSDSNSGNSGSSLSGSSDSSSQSQQPTPAHQHSWTPVYKTVHHDAVTEQQPVYERHTVCSDCGAVTPSRDHLENHLLNGSSGGTHDANVLVGYKTTIKQEAYNEQVVDHYACNCGATK